MVGKCRALDCRKTFYDIVQRRWKQAGIPPVSPHDFRKTFISTLLSKGVDVFTVQRMAGHANPQTTSRYDLRPEEEARAAAEGDTSRYLRSFLGDSILLAVTSGLHPPFQPS